MKPLAVGTEAPEFVLKDQDGNEHSLGTYRGTWVLLYFYPKDSTPGCTTEACVLRDTFADFQTYNCVVLGVSTDTEKSHRAFAEKYKLPFPLLADAEKTVVKAYGVWAPKRFMGREFLGTRRMSFLIDPQGNIAKVYETVKPALHATEVLADLQTLRG